MLFIPMHGCVVEDVKLVLDPEPCLSRWVGARGPPNNLSVYVFIFSTVMTADYSVKLYCDQERRIVGALM